MLSESERGNEGDVRAENNIRDESSERNGNNVKYSTRPREYEWNSFDRINRLPLRM